MRTGKLASVLCSSGWNLLYTVPRGQNGVVSIRLVNLDGSTVNGQIGHVAQGNGGSSPASSDIITPLVSLGNGGGGGSSWGYGGGSADQILVSNYGVNSLDDIWVYASVADELVGSVNTAGLEYRRELNSQG